MNIIEDQKINDVSPKIKHGFFGRQGGVSEGIYESLNCGVGSNDDPKAVMENRARVAQALGVTPQNMVRVWQSHTADCVIVTEPNNPNEDPVIADAMVTDKAGLALGVLTADCGCVLFAGQKADGAPVIGAAHAGWKGALGGVLESTVQAMQDLGVEPQNINAAIGPSIGPKSYEVSMGFEEPFLTRNPDDEHFFKAAQRSGHLMFDLPGYIASRLSSIGLRQITITGHDTFSQPDQFFSYRRTTHANELDYGRQISAIVISD